MPQLVGGLRPTEVFLPENYNPKVAAPLVIMMHGYSLDSYSNDNLLKYKHEAYTRGLIYVMPNGIKNSFGLRFWAATDACCDDLGLGWDDSDYLMSIVDEVSMRYTVD